MITCIPLSICREASCLEAHVDHPTLVPCSRSQQNRWDEGEDGETQIQTATQDSVTSIPTTSIKSVLPVGLRPPSTHGLCCYRRRLLRNCSCPCHRPLPVSTCSSWYEPNSRGHSTTRGSSLDAPTSSQLPGFLCPPHKNIIYSPYIPSLP